MLGLVSSNFAKTFLVIIVPRTLKRSHVKWWILMSVKLHYVDAHLELFPDNCGWQGEETGEKHHQDALPYERRYQA